EVAEDDRHAVELGQAGDGEADAFPLLARDRGLVRERRAVGRIDGVVGWRAALPVARALAPKRDRLVRDDAQEPVPDRPALVVAVPGAEGLEERAARRILGSVAVAEDAQRDAEELVLVLPDRVGERQVPRPREGAGHHRREGL